MNDLPLTKQVLREKMRKRRQGMPLKEKESADRDIAQHVLALSVVRRARTICINSSTVEEADTHSLILMFLDQGKRVVVPRVVGSTIKLFSIRSLDDIAPGRWGIREPKEYCPSLAPGEVDIFIIPGVAFDRLGHRLGMGKGYYDRLLADIAVPKIGLAYAVQMVPHVPSRSHDILMTTIITEQEVIGVEDI